MKTSSFRHIVLLIGLIALSILAACSGGDDGGSDGESSSAISMMHYFNEEVNEPAPAAQLEKLEEFKSNNSDVKIEEEIQSHDNYETKIKTLAAGNELPDVFLIKGSMVKTFADNGQILKLNDFLNEKEGWKESFVDGTMTPYKVKEEVYGVPISGGATHLIYYNKELFDKAGIDEFPKTWDEFMNTIDKLNEAGVTPIALGNKGKWVMNSSYLSTLGNRFTGSEWFMNILNNEGDAKFTDKKFVNALEAINQMAKNDAFNENMNSIDSSQQQAMYVKEKAAMFIEGDWAAGTVMNDAPENVLNATEVAIFPKIEGAAEEQNTVSGGGGWAYAINANVSDEKLKTIKEMIYHLTNQEAGKLILSKGQLPAVTVPDKESMDIPVLTKKILSVVEQNKYVPIYDTVLAPSIIEVMNSNLQNMLIGEVSPEDAANNIQQEYERENK